MHFRASAIGLPCNRMRPDSNGSRPMMARISVDFPDPFGPMMAAIVPAGTENEISSKTRWVPRVARDFSTEMAGISSCSLWVVRDRFGIFQHQMNEAVAWKRTPDVDRKSTRL